jgi:hypothetical protein
MIFSQSLDLIIQIYQIQNPSTLTFRELKYELLVAALRDLIDKAPEARR